MDSSSRLIGILLVILSVELRARSESSPSRRQPPSGNNVSFSSRSNSSSTKHGEQPKDISHILRSNLNRKQSVDASNDTDMQPTFNVTRIRNDEESVLVGGTVMVTSKTDADGPIIHVAAGISSVQQEMSHHPSNSSNGSISSIWQDDSSSTIPIEYSTVHNSIGPSSANYYQENDTVFVSLESSPVNFSRYFSTHVNFTGGVLTEEMSSTPSQSFEIFTLKSTNATSWQATHAFAASDTYVLQHSRGNISRDSFFVGFIESLITALGTSPTTALDTTSYTYNIAQNVASDIVSASTSTAQKEYSALHSMVDLNTPSLVQPPMSAEDAQLQTGQVDINVPIDVSVEPTSSRSTTILSTTGLPPSTQGLVDETTTLESSVEITLNVTAEIDRMTTTQISTTHTETINMATVSTTTHSPSTTKVSTTTAMDMAVTTDTSTGTHRSDATSLLSLATPPSTRRVSSPSAGPTLRTTAPISTTTTTPQKIIPTTPVTTPPPEILTPKRPFTKHPVTPDAKSTPSRPPVEKTSVSPNDIPSGLPNTYIVLLMVMPWTEFCPKHKEFQHIVAKMVEAAVHQVLRTSQVVIANFHKCGGKLNPSRRSRLDLVESIKFETVVADEQNIATRKNKRSVTSIEIFLYLMNYDHVPDQELTRAAFAQLNSSREVFLGSSFGGSITSTTLYHTTPTTVTAASVAKVTQATPLEPGVIAAIVLAPIVILVVLGLVILRVILSRRRGKAMRSYFTDSREPSFDSRSTNDFAMSSYPRVRRSARGRKSNRSIGRVNTAMQSEEDLPSNPVNRAGLASMCYDTDLLGEEFKLIPNHASRLSELPEGCEDKNRYANVIPNAKTRVILPLLHGAPQSHYINANFVKGYASERAYIATQAPMDNTVYDFWRTVWEYQSQVIVMLTELQECGLSKCNPYWPSSEGADTVQKYENLEITLKKRDVKKDYIMSKLRLKETETKQWRDLVHFWFLGWPHHGVPESPIGILDFLDDVRPYMAISNGPTVVHCSPGTGRTGAFIAIHLCLELFDESESVDVLSCVHRLRQDRAGLLQTREQYIFIYTALNEYASSLQSGEHDSSGSGSEEDAT